MQHIIIAFHLVQLTGLDGQVIELNPDQVVSVRPVREMDHFGKGINCLIHTTDGKYLAVTETCDMVRNRLEE